MTGKTPLRIQIQTPRKPGTEARKGQTLATSIHRRFPQIRLTGLLGTALLTGSCSWFSDNADHAASDPRWEEMAPEPVVAPAPEPAPEPVADITPPAETAPVHASAAGTGEEAVTGTDTTPEKPEAALEVAAAPEEAARPATTSAALQEVTADQSVSAKPAEATPTARTEALPKAARPAPRTEAKTESAPVAAVTPPTPVTGTVPAEPVTPKKPFTRPLSRDVDPVVIPGEQLKSVLGKAITGFRLAAVRENGLETIPFQIDERDKHNDFVFTEGPDKGEDKDRGLFDVNDELVFMARDLGEPLENPSAYPAHKGSRPEIVKELVIADPIDGKKGYAYLTFWPGDAPAPSKTDYVTYKAAEDLVEATSFAVGFNKETPFAIDRSMIRQANGKFSDNRVDILKVRLRSTIWRFYDFDRNQDDFGSKTAAWIDGPVRVVLHKGISVRMILGIQSPKIWNDTIFYPYGLSYGIDVKTPFSIPSIFSKFEMYSGMDFRDLKGGTFYTNGMSKPVTITGNPNNPEIAALNANPDENRFAAIGWAGSYFIMRIKIPDEIPLKVNSYLIDDPNFIDPPERFPGAVPGMYFKIDDWLKVKQTNISIVTSVVVTDTFVPGQEKAFINRMDRLVRLDNPDK